MIQMCLGVDGRCRAEVVDLTCKPRNTWSRAEAGEVSHGDTGRWEGKGPTPSSYTAAWSVQQFPGAASTASEMHRHTGYQSPFVQDPVLQTLSC